MTVDEIVFTREALRRDLLTAVERREKAADEYDPEVDFPTEELIAAFAVASLQAPVAKYVNAVAERAQLRQKAREG